VDAPDLEWYIVILDECKSLDINDFLYDVSPYMVTRSLPPQRAASSNVSQSACHSVVPPCRIVKSDIFVSVECQRRRARDPLIPERILHPWAHYMEKGAEDLTSLGPYRVKSRYPI
jgi:hypothetical protein